MFAGEEQITFFLNLKDKTDFPNKKKSGNCRNKILKSLLISF
jgi:hypothetical protein